MKILFLFSLLFMLSCSEATEELSENKSSVVKEIGLDNYVKLDFENPKAIVMNCAKGRVHARLNYYESTAVEVHKSFLKYVDFEPKGDTLFINTKKWPSSDKTITKQINIYLPDLAYLETQLTSFTFLTFNTHDLKIKSENAAFRFSKCNVENLTLDLSDRSNMYIDSYCIFDTIDATIGKNSLLSAYGHVNKNFKFRSPSLDNLRLGNVPSSIFKWTK